MTKRKADPNGLSLILTLGESFIREILIKHGLDVNESSEARHMLKDFSEIEGGFIFKDCFGRLLEKLWDGVR